MSEPTTSRPRAARAGALALSLGLAAFVVANAQLGCDAPTTDAPTAATPDDAKAPGAKTDEPTTPSAAEPAAANDATPAAIAPEPAAAPTNPEAEPAPEAKPAPVFMPASKSGGDFGSVRFPGEQAQQPNQDAQQAVRQQANPAPRP